MKSPQRFITSSVFPESGGIVLPMLFMSPDPYDTVIAGKEFYGMDCGMMFSKQCQYEIQQLKGSDYWLPDSTFDLLMHGIMKQLSRVGFKRVVAHGYGPSTNYIASHSEDFKVKYNLVVMNCWGNDPEDIYLQCDHPATNKTSLMMYFRSELVRMENLPRDRISQPLGVMGKDPRIYASKEFGKSIVDFEIKKMKALIMEELSKLN
jgi:creatinine amidohydrolase/Fe(II)-dependent formamide hydrolase-like protein